MISHNKYASKNVKIGVLLWLIWYSSITTTTKRNKTEQNWNATIRQRQNSYDAYRSKSNVWLNWLKSFIINCVIHPNWFWGVHVQFYQNKISGELRTHRWLVSQNAQLMQVILTAFGNHHNWFVVIFFSISVEW